MTRVGDKYSNPFCVAALVLAKLQESADGFLVGDIMALMIGSSILLMSPGLGNFAGLSLQ